MSRRAKSAQHLPGHKYHPQGRHRRSGAPSRTLVKAPSPAQMLVASPAATRGRHCLNAPAITASVHEGCIPHSSAKWRCCLRCHRCPFPWLCCAAAAAAVVAAAQQPAPSVSLPTASWVKPKSVIWDWGWDFGDAQCCPATPFHSFSSFAGGDWVIIWRPVHSRRNGPGARPLRRARTTLLSVHQ